ncbi:hypothetical protein [Candidatus Regiella insecticola]|uniref:hypothetical protein n=1 Tax=Candidatus Regiella insecticola TaxID=138073 RepID=UPI0002DC7B6F|nr:hypothetical protein [Candidatus Regiella insecticola]
MLLEASGTQNYVSSPCNDPIIGGVCALGNNLANTLYEVRNIFYEIGSAVKKGVKSGTKFNTKLIPEIISVATDIARVGAIACLVIGGVSASITADSAAITASVVLFVGIAGGGSIGAFIGSTFVFACAALGESEGGASFKGSASSIFIIFGTGIGILFGSLRVGGITYRTLKAI